MKNKIFIVDHTKLMHGQPEQELPEGTRLRFMNGASEIQIYFESDGEIMIYKAGPLSDHQLVVKPIVSNKITIR